MCQSTALPYFLKEVCDVHDDEDGGKNVQLALAPAASFIGSLIYSLFVQDKFQRFHQYDKYNLFLYSIGYFSTAALLMFMIDSTADSAPFFLYLGLFFQGCGMANMMNSSTSLVSEMIGQDDQASAVVFASFNIVESFSVGGVAFAIMASGMIDSKSSLFITMVIIPVVCGLCAYLLSFWRFRNAAYEYLEKPDIRVKRKEI
mmetsp:Transcript_18905/g.32280  ORF Transcript_18905/g.32280 Transcript_18905/m.32280 type:complete len:202 (-) Transcript_18905:43-648(-)